MELNAITRYNSYTSLEVRAIEEARRKRKDGRRGSSRRRARRGGMKKPKRDSARRHKRNAKERGHHERSRELGAYNPWVQRRVKSLSVTRVIATFVNGVVRGGLAGYSLRLGFKLLPVLVATVRKGTWSRLLDRLRSIVINGVSEARFGLFVGGIVGSLRSALLFARYKGARAAHWGSVAGGVSAALCLLILPSSSHSSMALFFLVRAMEVIARHLVATKAVPAIPHADTLLMSLASAQVLWAWIFEPSCLDRSYFHFLNQHGGHPRQVVDMVGKCQTPGDVQPWAEVREFWARRGRTVVPVPSVYNKACEIRHPGQSCTVHLGSFWYQGFLRAIKVYLPVHVLPLIIFGHKRLLADPVASLQRVVTGIARSSSFLASYCTWAWMALCMQRQFGGVQRNWVGFTCGLVGGSSVMLEKQSRRVELALYVFSHALLAGWRIMVKRRWAAHIPNGSAMLFGASVAVLLQAYMISPRLLRSSYVSFVTWLLLWAKERPKPLARVIDATPMPSSPSKHRHTVRHHTRHPRPRNTAPLVHPPHRRPPRSALRKPRGERPANASARFPAALPPTPEEPHPAVPSSAEHKKDAADAPPQQ